MTATAGRGRGWGKNLLDNSENLQRPGKQSPPVVVENDEWFNRINKLDITDSESIISPTSPIANLVTRDASEEDIMHLSKLLELAINDRTFAIKLILTFSNKTNYLPVLMGCLQKIYDQKDEYFAKNPIQFHNMVFFLGEIFYHNEFIKCLKGPLVICIRMLLETAGEDEIKLAATQVAINGRALLAASSQGLNELFIYAREVLTTRNLSTRSRGMLLLMIDLYNQNFMPLSGDLQKFYVNQLGQSTLLDMQRNNENLLVITNQEPQDQAVEKGNNEPGILMKVPATSRRYSQLRELGGRPMSSVPRAIRGSGAVENHEQKNRNFDIQRSHRNDGNKGYGHDDRFSKDY